MIEQGEFYLAMIGLFVLYIILNMRSHAKLLDLLDELAFPSDDPIMTSTLTDDEVFEYPEMSTDEEVSAYAEANNVDIATAILETNPEVFVYEMTQETADEEPEVEIFTEGLEPRRTISFFEPDFPPLTLAQLKRRPKAELIELCERYGHATDGTKHDLFKRLVD